MPDTNAVFFPGSASASEKPTPFSTSRIAYRSDPSSMGELADRVGELKAAKAEIDAYLDRMRALFVASGQIEAEGSLFRVALSAESCSATLDRKAIEAAMGEAWLAKFLKWSKPSRTFSCCARNGKSKKAA